VPTAATLLSFSLASRALIVIPGPSVANVLAAMLRDGRRVGIAATLGVETGYLVHVAGTVLGISAVLAASTAAFTVLEVVGGGYLPWLAWRSWRSRDERTLAQLAEPGGSPLSARGAFLRALPVGALNPKTAIFYLAFLPQFVQPAAGPVALQLLVLGLLFILLATVVDVQWALLGGGLRRVLPWLRRTCTACSPSPWTTSTTRAA
jgi:threonine/homoserine/homoserine lactone efflux protein